MSPIGNSCATARRAGAWPISQFKIRDSQSESQAEALPVDCPDVSVTDCTDPQQLRGGDFLDVTLHEVVLNGELFVMRLNDVADGDHAD